MSVGHVLGVTGGIACGKSLVTSVLAELGWPVLSADQVARDVVAPGTALLTRLVKEFGVQILLPSGALDRDVLGRLVFELPDARTRLNRLMHPAIAEESTRRLTELRDAQCPFIVYEAPLLFEAGAESRVNEVLVVFVDGETQLDRLQQRDGISREAARAKVDAHWPQHEKITRADYVIDNSGSMVSTQRQVEALYHYLMRACLRPG